MTAPTTPLAAVVEALREALDLSGDECVDDWSVRRARELLAKLAALRGWGPGFAELVADIEATAPGPAGAEVWMVRDNIARWLREYESLIEKPTSAQWAAQAAIWLNMLTEQPR